MRLKTGRKAQIKKAARKKRAKKKKYVKCTSWILLSSSELEICSTVQAQRSGALLQVLSQLLIKSFRRSMPWGRETGRIGREGRAYITGPVTSNSWLGRACSTKLWVARDSDFICLSVSTLEQSGEQTVPGHERFCFLSVCISLGWAGEHMCWWSAKNWGKSHVNLLIHLFISNSLEQMMTQGNTSKLSTLINL